MAESLSGQSALMAEFASDGVSDIVVSDHVKVNKSEQMPTLPFFQIRIIMPAADEGSSVEPSCGTIHRNLRVV